MKIGRRSKHVSLKSLFSGPVLRRLNRRERQELAEKSGAAKAPVKPQRPTFGLESVEPRLLMSVTLPITATHDVMTMSIGGTAGAPTVIISDSSGQLASSAVTSTEIDVNSAQVIAGQTLSAGDTLNINLSNFSLLNTFVGGNGNELTIKFNGGNEQFSSLGSIAAADTMNIQNSGSLAYGLTIDSTSVINSGATLTAKDLTLTSAQTAGDLLTTGLFANANTGVELTGAHLTTTAGALTLN